MNNGAIEKFIDSIKEPDFETNRTNLAVVSKVDAEGVVWVNLVGADRETPTASTSAEVKSGDIVNVEWRNNKLYIAGNYTNPSAGVTRVVYVEKQADVAKDTADIANKTAGNAEVKAVDAKETAESILIYDTSYTLDNRVATFQAHVYQGGVDIHTAFDAELFTWYLKNEESDENQYLGAGYTVTVNLSQCGYGSEVVGVFTLNDDAEALAEDGSTYTTIDGDTFTVRATGDSVRVRDLTVSTTLYSTDKVMMVGAEDEHLVTLDTLQMYLNENLDKQVYFDTTAGWNAQSSLVSQEDKIYIYTDYKTDGSGNKIAGIKIGDGNAYLIDKPFIDELYFDHIQDNSIHVTTSDKQRWNNAVNCYYSGDILTFVHV